MDFWLLQCSAEATGIVQGDLEVTPLTNLLVCFTVMLSQVFNTEENSFVKSLQRMFATAAHKQLLILNPGHHMGPLAQTERAH